LKYIEKILRCVCHRCYKIKTPSNLTDAHKKKLKHLERIENNSKKLNELTKMLQNISQCKGEIKVGNESKKIGCGQQIPTNITLKNYKFWASDTDNNRVSRIM